ncbi:MAG: FAD-binding oxidoreductase, partial [Candidatus Hodarchaeota archaeon]
MTENIIRTVKVDNIIDECNGVKTIFFNLKKENKDYVTPKPGQFIMIWIPGVDEVPMSISGYDNNGNWSITVKNVGECTNAIHNLAIGDYIGVRGPLGNYFQIPTNKSKKIILIGGGIGMAPIKWLSSELLRIGYHFILIQGAKIEKELMFINDFQLYNQNISEFYYCTDDGSYGVRSIASETFENLIKNYSKSDLSNLIVYSCGPEKMIYKVFQLCERYNIELQASLERIMRCG